MTMKQLLINQPEGDNKWPYINVNLDGTVNCQTTKPAGGSNDGLDNDG